MPVKSPYDDFLVLDDSCVDIKNRIIYLVGEIAEGSVDSVVQQLNYLSSSTHCKEADKEIKIVINSTGGDVDMMFYLYDSIILCPAPIVTIGSGTVCSAACLLLVSGNKRYATPNCWFMAHQGDVTFSGSEDAMIAQADLTRKISDRYWRLLSRHTKKTPQAWYNRSKHAGELWLDTNEMLSYGVIDAILEGERELPKLSKSKIKTVFKEPEEHEEEESDDDC